MMGRLITLVVLLMAALVVGRVAVAQTNSAVTVSPLTELTSLDPSRMDAFQPWGGIPVGAKDGYATKYWDRSLKMLFDMFEDPLVWAQNSHVACDVFLRQIAATHPEVAKFTEEGCAGFGRALESDPGFVYENCPRGKFLEDGSSLTNIAGSRFGQHHRDCYKDEHVIAYKGDVLFSTMCMNVDIPAFQAPPAPVVAQAPAVVVGATCPQGQLIVANAVAVEDIPEPLQSQVLDLIRKAQKRDSHDATYAPAYQPDDVSRFKGTDIRMAVLKRASVNDVIHIYYRKHSLSDPAVEGFVGDLKLTSGTGSFRFQPGNDPRGHITDFVWPSYFASPTESGGQNHLWVFWYEWGPCEDHIMGIVFKGSIPTS